MKSIHIIKAVTFYLIAMILSACSTDESIKVDPMFELTFQRNGSANAKAGEVFFVVRKGSGEFLTLFDGTPGKVWGEPGAKGIDFNKSDSLPVSYSSKGAYKLTVVATSTSDMGKTIEREHKTIEINVVDERNSITNFFINNIAGEFTAQNEIIFSVPDITTDFKFKPIFNLSSTLAKAFVNGVQQVSGTTENDFTNPVIYTVKSDQGVERNYTIKFNRFTASNEKEITSFKLGTGTRGNSEVGIIDESTKTITLNLNYGTNPSTVNLFVESSFGSRIIINSNQYLIANATRTTYNLNTTAASIKVIAQNNTETTYTVVYTTQLPVSSFTFTGLVPAPVGVIDHNAKTITVGVLSGTDITKLVAKWVGSTGTVRIGSVQQTNGISVNNFSTNLQYTFLKGTTIGDIYTVIVNIK